MRFAKRKEGVSDHWRGRNHFIFSVCNENDDDDDDDDDGVYLCA